MNKLKKIRIQGFKSIVDQEIEPGQVNVLIGANGSGKTALLEAIGMLSAAISGTVDNEALQRRGVHLTTPQLYKSSFKDIESHPIDLSLQWLDVKENEQWHYAVELENSNENPEGVWAYQAESLKLNKQLIFLQRQQNQVETSLKPQYYETSTTYEGAVINFALSQSNNASLQGFAEFLKQLKAYAIYTPTTPMLRDLVTDTRAFSTTFMGLSGNRLANAIQGLIDVKNETYGHMDWDEVQELLDWIDSIAVGQPTADIISPYVPRLQQVIRLTDRFMRENNNVFTVHDASEGSLYVLFLLTLAMHPYAPRFFAVENFDQALHPHLACATAELFCQALFDNPRQPTAFLTTHNPLVLDGISILDDRIRLFAINRNHKGHTTIRRILVTEELLNQGKQGMSLSRLWVMGRLGGVPRS
jgi:predicted ATPase